ncbi:MAG: LPXTG cell wall anchor domain-containing protein [Oscillospiraceae bacterium]|nr:LPXTG cell wall anchor domain-containing protein [Oscillospiraceae bacterium]
MNKNFKRIISSILAAMIVLSATTAFATEVTVDTVDDSSSSTTVGVKPIGAHGNIKITIKPSALNTTVSGIELKLEKLKDGSGDVDTTTPLSITLTSDKDGVVYFEGTDANPIPAGNYKISFVKNASAYKTPSVDVTTTDLATTVTGELSLEINVGTVTGKIVDTATPPVGVPDIELGLYSKVSKTGEPVSTTTSTADGSYSFKDVPYGMYTLKAVNTPEGSTIKGIDVTVDKAAITAGDIIIADLTKFTVNGTLIDSTNKTPIQGATFELYSYTKDDMSDQALVSELATTDIDGKFSFVDVDYVKGTKYFIKQKSTIEGQTLDTTMHKLNGTGIPTGDVLNMSFDSVPVSTDPTTPPTTPDTNKPGTTNPTTGDSSSMLLFLVLGLGAVGFAGSSLTKKNKKSSDA